MMIGAKAFQGERIEEVAGRTVRHDHIMLYTAELSLTNEPGGCQ
jgi:hypothetical protein